MGDIWYDGGKNQAKVNPAWWTASKAEVNRAVHGMVELLMEAQPHHRRRDLSNLNLYGDVEGAGLEPWRYERLMSDSGENSYNICESAVDTLHAEIVEARPKPMFLTDGGNFEQIRQAKGMGQVINGQFYHLGVHSKLAPRAARDALILGSGGLLVWRDREKNEAVVERAMKTEFMVDDAEAHDGSPRSLYRRKYVSREEMKANYPKLKSKLKDTVDASEGTKSANIVDMIAVSEAWHLRSSESAGDGRHVVCVENVTIIDEDWNRDYFPTPWCHFKERPFGYWGKGVCEILAGSQVNLNQNIFFRDECIRLSMPKLVIPRGSGINTAHLDNEIYGIIEADQAPFLFMGPSVPPDVFQAIRDDIQDAFSKVGVSMLTARSEIPAGLDGGSGKALRLYSDKKSKRFLHFQSNYEEMHMELSRQLVDVNREIAKHGPIEVLSPLGDGTAKTIEWGKVDLDGKPYMMQVWPTSFLTGSPQDKLADIEALIGMVPEAKDHLIGLLDFPDLEGATSLITAGVDAAKIVIERIMDTGEAVAPEPFMNLALTLNMAQSYYLRAKYKEGAPDDRLQALRDFMALTHAAMTPPEAPVPEAAPPIAPGAPPPPMPPMPGDPGPPPMPMPGPAPVATT